jgi:hypothetical protein
MNNFIYLRGLRSVSYSVFCVQEGQKKYYDPVFNRSVPFSSGQQVKRSIFDHILFSSDLEIAPTEFNFKVDGKMLKEGEALSECDPTYFDQLIGGYMRAVSGGAEKTIKRRSPLSISAFRALHPLLSSLSSEDITFDRTSNSAKNRVVIKDKSGKQLTDEEVTSLLQGTDRSLNRKWVPDSSGSNNRFSGLFVYDVAIDLRTLFSVSTNKFEPEVNPTTIEKLKLNGWESGSNFLGECLIAPKSLQDKLIPLLVDGLINWRVTSNQSRTFDLTETLAVGLSYNANKLSMSLRADLDFDQQRRAKPVIDSSVDSVQLFVTPSANAYLEVESSSSKALDDANETLCTMIKDGLK